jgi:hypothetical protein
MANLRRPGLVLSSLAPQQLQSAPQLVLTMPRERAKSSVISREGSAGLIPLFSVTLVLRE